MPDFDDHELKASPGWRREIKACSSKYVMGNESFFHSICPLAVTSIFVVQFLISGLAKGGKCLFVGGFKRFVVSMSRICRRYVSQARFTLNKLILYIHG